MSSRMLLIFTVIAMALVYWLVSSQSPTSESAQAPASSTMEEDVTRPSVEAAPQPEPTVVGEPPAADPASQDAVDAAAAFMSSWLDESDPQWWPRLEPMMTEAGAQLYDSVDPASIRSGVEVRAAELLDGGSIVSCRVQVETTVGAYVVYLLREAEEGPWLVDRMDQPESRH